MDSARDRMKTTIKKSSEFNGYEGGMKIKWITNKYYIMFRTHHSHFVYISREKKCFF